MQRALPPPTASIVSMSTLTNLPYVTSRSRCSGLNPRAARAGSLEESLVFVGGGQVDDVSDHAAALPQQPLQIGDPPLPTAVGGHHGIDDDRAVVFRGEPTNCWGRRRRRLWSGPPDRVPVDRLCRLGGRGELTPWRERVKWPPCVLADRVTCRRRLCCS